MVIVDRLVKAETRVINSQVFERNISDTIQREVRDIVFFGLKIPERYS